MNRKIALFLVLCPALAPAQQLHRGIESADLIVAAQQQRSLPFGEHYVLHELAVLRTIKGQAQERVTVVEVRGVSLHQTPAWGERRLYCLHDFTTRARAAGLPAGPCYKMSGYPGSDPALGQDLAADENVRFAAILAAAENGVSPARIAEAVLRIALGSSVALRTEAVEVLSERAVLQDRLSPLQMSQVLSRAVAETRDIPYKIALATLCADKRMDHLVDSLCLCMRMTEDAAFARALGRIARTMHGEGAVDVLRPHIVEERDSGTRSRLLLALGATSTEAALQALLRMREIGGPDRSVDAALAEHGSPRAVEAITGKKSTGR